MKLKQQIRKELKLKKCNHKDKFLQIDNRNNNKVLDIFYKEIKQE